MVGSEPSGGPLRALGDTRPSDHVDAVAEEVEADDRGPATDAQVQALSASCMRAAKASEMPGQAASAEISASRIRFTLPKWPKRTLRRDGPTPSMASSALVIDRFRRRLR